VVDDPSPTSKPATADATEPATDSTPSDGTEPADGVNVQPDESAAGSAADAMGPGGAPAGEPLRDGGSATAAADTADAPTGAAETTEAADAGSADGDATDHGDATARGTGADDTDRTTVRITQDVGEILGVDERTYELSAEDVVTLPAVNATPLLDRDAAEQL
jgi:DNA replication factor GINS